MNELQKFQEEKKHIEKFIIIGGVGAIIGVALAVLLSELMFIGIIIALPAFIMIGIQSSKFSKLSHKFKMEVVTLSSL